LSGGRFAEEFAFPAGRIAVRATVGSTDTELLLWDIDIFAIDAPRIAIGVVGVRALIAELCRLAAEDGFDTLTMSGYRTGGASPFRDATVTMTWRRRS
jgi:hypothetical protein